MLSLMCMNLFSKEIQKIQLDQSNGASQIAQNALDILKLYVKTTKISDYNSFIKNFTELGRQLFRARPNMAPVPNLIAEVVYEVNSLDACDLIFAKNFALSKIDDIYKKSKSAVKASAEFAAKKVADFDCVATCSYSSTICETFKIAKHQKKSFKVFVAESKNDNVSYGKVLATFLSSIDVNVEEFTDKQISRHIPKATIVLVGADSVLSDGSVINGTPTFEVAVKAKEAGVPFYSVCETAKVNMFSYLDKKVEVKQGFDKVPANLLTGIITENGILSNNNIIDLMKEKARYFEVFSFGMDSK